MNIMQELDAAVGFIREQQFQARMEGCEIERVGNKVQIPEHMSLEDAITWLSRKKAEEDTTFSVREVVDTFPFDALITFIDLIERKYGVSLTSGEEIHTPFGSFKLNARMISIEVAPGVIRSVPWGKLFIPGIDAEIRMDFVKKDNRLALLLAAEVAGKNREALNALFAELRKEIKVSSIYRGQAIKMDFRDSDGDCLDLSPDVHPKFMNLASAETAIFNESTERQIEVALLNPIRHTSKLRERGIPVGRKILLEGDYGTGKSLTAALVAKECVANGWTFVYVSDCRDLDKGLEVARQYSPAAVFVEDVDHVVKTVDVEDRDYEIQKLSTCLDGIENKDREVMVIMTTNNVHDIPKVLQRPGRMDAIINIGRPDLDTTVKLIRHYATGMISTNIGNNEIANAIKPIIGQSASFIREVVERAKLSAIANPTSEIDAIDLHTASEMMVHHSQILEAK